MYEPTDEDIYAFLLGRHVEVGEMYCSPIPHRQDDTPSFGLYEENGVVKWKDFGLSNPYGNKAINLLMYMRDLPMNKQGYAMAKEIVRREVKRGIYGQPPAKLKRGSNSKKELPLIEWSKDFTDYELAYWSRFGINRDILLAERIYALRMLAYGSRENGVASAPHDPAFLYLLQEARHRRGVAFKTYRPLTENKRDKFRQWNISNVIEGWLAFKPYCQKLKQEGRKIPLFVGLSSTKDRLVMRKAGFVGLNPTGETAWRTFALIDPIIDEIAERKVWLLDADDAGFKASQDASRELNGWEYVDMRGKLGRWKDFSDYIDTEKGNHSYEELVELLNRIL